MSFEDVLFMAFSIYGALRSAKSHGMSGAAQLSLTVTPDDTTLPPMSIPISHIQL